MSCDLMKTIRNSVDWWLINDFCYSVALCFVSCVYALGYAIVILAILLHQIFFNFIPRYSGKFFDTLIYFLSAFAVMTLTAKHSCRWWFLMIILWRGSLSFVFSKFNETIFFTEPSWRKLVNVLNVWNKLITSLLLIKMQHWYVTLIMCLYLLLQSEIVCGWIRILNFRIMPKFVPSIIQ